MARFFALVTAVLAAATIVSGQVSSPIGNTFQPGRGANIGTDIYFPDTAGHVIVKLTAAGSTSIVAGRQGVSGSTEGNSTDLGARFNAPQGVCTDGTNLWVMDTGNNKIRKIVLTSGQTSTPFGPVAGTAAATTGDVLGTASATANTDARFNGPTDCQFIGTDAMYIADAGNNKIKKAVISTGAVTILTGPVAGTTTAAVPAAGTTANNNARFSNPSGLCTDGTDLYVTDTTNNVFRKITVADGTTTTNTMGPTDASAGYVDSTTAANVKFNTPTDCLYTGTAGVFIVADKNNHALRRLTSTAAATWVGAGVAGDDNAAAGADAKLWSPIGVVGDAATTPSNVFALEQYSRIRKVVGVAASAGAVSLVGGTINTAFPSNPVTCVLKTDYFCVDSTKHVVWKIVAATGVATVFAGTEGSAGDVAGVAGTGKLNAPQGIATDGTNFVIADTGNNKLRFLTTSTGALSTPGGYGGADGTTASGSTLANDNTARYNAPAAVAIKSADTFVYVADTGNHRIVKLTIAGGTIGTLFSGTGVSGDAVGANAAATQFNSPAGLCIIATTATAGDFGLVVSDTGNNKLKGITVNTAAAGLGFVTTAGTSFLLSGGSVSTAGDVTTAATSGTVRWNAPKGCAADSDTTGAAATFIVVADSGNNKVKKVTMDPTDTNRVITTLGAADAGTSVPASGNVVSSTANLNRFSGPTGVFRVAATNFVIVDAGNRELKKYDATSTVIRGFGGTDPVFPSALGTTIANSNTAGANPFLTATTQPTADGNITLFNGVREAAGFNASAAALGSAVDTWYVVDSANHAIRKVVFNVTSGASTVSTYLGTPGTSGDSITSGSVTFSSPTAIVANGTDTLYVADSGNHKIKKIVIAADGTATVTIFSGPAAATSGLGDAVGDAATSRYNSPQGLAIASNGNLYVADTNNQRIKVITPAGVSSVAWGAAAAGVTTGTTAAAPGADSATAASVTFATPKGLAGNGTFILVADSSSHRIRQCTVGAGCTTWLGAASGNADGTGTAATFNTPTGISFDQFGNVYVADTGNHKIRKATSAGVVTTVVGTASATAGTAGATDQAAATSTGVYATATLNAPTYVFFSKTQPTLAYISDSGNNKIRTAAALGSAAVTATATATATNTTTITVTNTSTATVTTAANTTTASTTSSNSTTTAPTTTATKSSNAVVAAATAVVVAVLAIFA